MTTGSEIKQLDVEEARAQIEAGNTCAIDIRMAFDYAGGRIFSSINLPNDSIKVRSPEVPAGKALLFISDDGVASERVCQIALAMGFANVANLQGGIMAWEDAGLPLETISEGLTSGI